jgi:hypothetical protein
MPNGCHARRLSDWRKTTIMAALLLVVLALVFLLAAALGRLPIWPAVLCLILERVLELYPRGVP